MKTCFIFLPRDASAERGYLTKIVRPSVCDVEVPCPDHTGWNTSNIISQLISGAVVSQVAGRLAMHI